jgi:hypothetical protein
MGKEKQPESKSKAEKQKSRKAEKNIEEQVTWELRRAVKRPIVSKREVECKHPA